MAEAAATGFFGKLPSRGDFVSRRLPSQFVDAWDRWLQQSLASSKTQLASEWLDVYLTSPVWCFALSPQVCGEVGYIGVMIPSVDRVGRYFPLVAAMPQDAESILAPTREFRSWFADTQSVLLEALDEPPLEFESFDQLLADAGITLPEVPSRGAGAADVISGRESAGGTRQWRFTIPREQDLVAACADVLASDQKRALDVWAIWWTNGSEHIDPCVLLTSGLPEPESFAAMLDGFWSERGWSALALADGASAEGEASGRSAAFTDVGKQRSVNEDSFACDDAAGIWLVADGLGGHEAGDVASRMVASVIERVLPQTSLEQRVERVSESLAVVNACLCALKGRGPRGELVASTSAALVLENTRVACIWAGDSRIYRFRDGQLEQLTTDHSGANADGVTESEDAPRDHTITRAVGGAETLELDVSFHDTQPGDRFLLCTDGVYGEMRGDELVEALLLEQPEAVCDALKERVLAGSAPDNLTAVVVDVSAQPERVPEILRDVGSAAPAADGSIYDTVPGRGSWGE